MHMQHTRAHAHARVATSPALCPQQRNRGSPLLEGGGRGCQGTWESAQSLRQHTRWQVSSHEAVEGREPLLEPLQLVLLVLYIPQQASSQCWG